MLPADSLSDFHDSKEEKGVQRIRNGILVIILLLSLGLVFGIMATYYKRTYENARNDVIELSKSSSSQNAESIEMFFARHEDILLATAEIIEHGLLNDNISEEDIKNLLYNLSEEYSQNIYKRFTDRDFTGIYASVNGKLIHAYREDGDLPEDYDPTTRQWYSEGIEGGGKVVFGEPYYDAYDPTIKVMTVTQMLSDHESVIGMDITLEDLQYAGGNMDVSVTLNGERHDYGHGFILTDKGIVMAHWDESEQGKDYNTPDSPMYEVFRKIKSCVNSSNDYLETDINDGHYGIFPNKLNNGWYVVTLTELEDIRTTISDFATLTFIATALIIFIGVMYCFIILRAYTRAKMLSRSLQNTLSKVKLDVLTNLGNRAAFDVRVRELKENINTRKDIPFVLIMMDLNDLKYINDHYGHAAGDQYILNCCKLFHDIVPCEVYRIGGDEFALFLTGDEYDRWEDLFDQLKLAVDDANIKLTPDVDNPSISMGLALHTVGSDDIDELMRKADSEMYTNKVAIKQARLTHSEKGYTEDLKIKLMDKQMLASELQIGLNEEQFEVWFQPQVNHDNNGALIGAEALVRWRHPKRGMVSPAVFIPIFEYNGIIYELDKYVWKHTCKCIRRWLDKGMMPLPVSVNASRLDIIQPDFVEVITSYVEEENVPIDLLHIEVTESAFSDDTGKVVEVVKELVSRGFIIAIDDFGSGYSSLSLLRSVPAHIVKLDMRFFADGEDKSRNECIIESIIRMVKMLGMAVLAEGVEYKEQADLLHALGCAYIQGFLYSKPLPYEEYIEYTRKAEKEVVNRLNKLTREEINEEDIQSRKLFHNIISGTNDVIIVTDNKTRQLLYANRAAEEYYGRRFDPLNPTTCSQYCGEKGLCDNCPAVDMKPGERREFEISDNGIYIKYLYTQMDWNGYDAVVLYLTDITAQMREVELANTIINNLGVGIVIFRGDTPSELKPMFFNKEFKKLSGLNDDGVRTLLVKDCLYGVYPDDIEQAREKFSHMLRSHKPMQHYLRVKKADDKYEWVSMYANANKRATGGIEVYMIFADAEAEINMQMIETKRYRNHIEKFNKNTKTFLSVIHINVTKDICHSVHWNISVNNKPVLEKKLNDFIESAKMNIPDEKLREEFVNRFNSKTLIKKHERGILTDEICIPLRLSDQRIIWCYQTVDLSRNPNTHDLEAVMSLTEADKNIRLQAHSNWIINADYDCVGEVDVPTGLVTIVSEPNNRDLPDIRLGAVPYMENLDMRMSLLVNDEDIAACVEALSFDTIIERLKTEKYYTCTFKARNDIIDGDAIFIWKYGYVDESNTEIIFTRRLIVK